MAGIVQLSGPVPPAGRAPLGWCAVCAAVAKYTAMAGGIRAEVDAHERRGTGVQHWTLDIDPAPQPAVAWGLYPPLGAALPLCWSHLVAIESRPGGVLPAGPEQMPGVPLLGQGLPR